MDLSLYTTRIIVGALFSTFLAGRGLKKRSLDKTGATAAWLVGFIACLAGIRLAAVLVAFFQMSTWLTKYKGNLKKKLEDGYKEGGGRNWEQVLANAFTGTAISLLYLYTVGHTEFAFDVINHPWASSILAAYIGHYACCNGDTWASELGILSKQTPRLITTFRQVPAGTNGGITLLGCVASTLGGFVIGLSFYVVDFAVQFFYGRQAPVLLPVLFLGTASGIIGSLVDSLLGATVQWSGWSESKKKVVQGPPATGVKHICGIDLLNNHHVNFLSSLIVSILAGLFSHQLTTLLF